MKDPRATRWLTRSDGLATRLRQARGKRSQAKFAEPLGWAPSKVTRIEQGIQVPSDEDLDEWAREACLSKNERGKLHAMLEEFQSMRSSFRDRMRNEGGQEGVQQGYNDLYVGATLIRSYQTAWVPGILQTRAYATAVLEHMADVHNSDRDVDKAVEKRLERRALLQDDTRVFEFIVHGSVLESVFVPVPVLKEQLRWLLMVTDMPRVRFGVVPLRRPIKTAPQAPFVMYDDLVVTETFIGEVKAKPVESDFYSDIMTRLWRDAAEGEDARQLIQESIGLLPAA
jgi:transcriptional regulator with XRE-family HTH domain